MARIASPEAFSDVLIKDFNWRLKELSDLKVVADCADTVKLRGRRRALIVMCYAHWEGHAKYCAEKFIEYITIRRLRFSEVSSHFYLIRFINEIGNGSALGLAARMALVEKILNSSDERLSKIPEGIINTRSNLNSEVLDEICVVCGIPSNIFSDDRDFLDRILLKRRNEVAHGEAVFIDSIEPDDLVNRTTALMRLFRDSLDNAIATTSYRRS